MILTTLKMQPRPLLYSEYTCFEIYIPLYYATTELDPRTGRPRKIYHSVDHRVIRGFINGIVRKFNGVTQSNPAAPTLLKGKWRPHQGESLDIDYLMIVMVFVKIDRHDEALKYFEDRKRRLETALNQNIILITFFPLKSIGDFF